MGALRRRVAVACAVAGTVGILAGCSQQSVPPASERSCEVFGINALERHVTVTFRPAACAGLTPAQVNDAVAGALATVAGTAHGKAAERARASSLSPLLAHLVRAVPAPQPVSAPAVKAAQPARRGGNGPLGVAALLCWLVTVALGARMLAGWIVHGGLRRERGGRLPPSAIFAHAGLAVGGLLVWGVYLTTRLNGVGWAGCVCVIAVTGLGVALISLWLPEQSAATRPARHPPAGIVAAHGVFAVTTILLVLAALGFG